ncbi:NUDIX hydrolase [Vogesella indigofera]|uniref:NUDIX hydrolase n=1 Tax=Vogesella indigofera TaxID=45465 RepID=UPI00234C2A5E|nr:NUDIX domain-containing protein [Vogesella indigofera]MDC7704189.1 NUDIX domain-containing protein [Vogesella indigofera]
MNHLQTIYHLQPTPAARVQQRLAVRGIVARGRELLLLYTGRYDDYSLPGGGVEANEDHALALARELAEETGARDVRILQPFGLIDEFRPPRGDYDVLHMLSYCYVCRIAATLAAPQMEAYEINNRMQPRWLDVDTAIAHNQAVLAHGAAGMGLSIVRETALLRRIAQALDAGEL